MTKKFKVGSLKRHFKLTNPSEAQEREATDTYDMSMRKQGTKIPER